MQRDLINVSIVCHSWSSWTGVGSGTVWRRHRRWWLFGQVMMIMHRCSLFYPFYMIEHEMLDCLPQVQFGLWRCEKKQRDRWGELWKDQNHSAPLRIVDWNENKEFIYSSLHINIPWYNQAFFVVVVHQDLSLICSGTLWRTLRVVRYIWNCSGFLCTQTQNYWRR